MISAKFQQKDRVFGISIPKIIHYCWFGKNPKPLLIKKCIRSWKKYCPDYQIIEWNEDNIDLSTCPLYVQQAYSVKKWAFVTDWVRLKVLHDMGGFYMDTDMELFRTLDNYRQYACFMGFQHEKYVATGLVVGAVPQHEFIAENASVYNNVDFLEQDSAGKYIICQEYTTALLQQRGSVIPCNGEIQIIDDIHIFPPEYFCPYDHRTGILNRTENSVAMHHFASSWHSEERNKAFRKSKRKRLFHEVTHIPHRFFRSVLGDSRYEKIKSVLKRKHN